MVGGARTITLQPFRCNPDRVNVGGRHLDDDASLGPLNQPEGGRPGVSLGSLCGLARADRARRNALMHLRFSFAGRSRDRLCAGARRNRNGARAATGQILRAARRVAACV